jgi:hypothetical protein
MAEVDAVLAVAFPVRLMVPLPALLIAYPALIVETSVKTLPMILIVPLEELITPCEFILPDPPNTLPAMFIVPPELFRNAQLPLAAPPITSATTVHDCPAVKYESKGTLLVIPGNIPLPTSVQVNVIPFIGTNAPPTATTGEVSTLLLSERTV